MAAPVLMLNPISRSPVAEALRHWTPRTDFGKAIRSATKFLPEDLALELIERASRIVVVQSSLSLVKFDRFGRAFDYGVVGEKVVTDAGVGYIVDAFQNSVELENMKYHGYGTGTTAENANQTALVTELTTEYATDNTRPTGTTTENAANIYETVATLSPNAGGTIALREHGIFSQAANSGGTLLDRTLFDAVNVVASADSLQSTYRLTFTSGS